MSRQNLPFVAVIAVTVLAVVVAVRQGWRPNRRFLVWVVGGLAIFLTPFIVNYVGNLPR